MVAEDDVISLTVSGEIVGGVVSDGGAGGGGGAADGQLKNTLVDVLSPIEFAACTQAM